MFYRKPADPTPALALILSLLASSVLPVSYATDELRPMPAKFKDTFFMTDYTNKLSFLQLMDQKIKPALDAIYRAVGRKNDADVAVAEGRGVAIELSPQYWNFHVNYADGLQSTKAKDETSGRSFAMGPNGIATDASDAYYLTELGKMVKTIDDAELARFYTAIVRMIGANDPQDLPLIEREEVKAVLIDFMTVYGAEEDRHLMSNLGAFNWDDALWEVTMIAALHGGQSTFTKFYEKKFSPFAYDQMFKSYKSPEKREASAGNPFIPAVKDATGKVIVAPYAAEEAHGPRPTVAAKMKDYWQFGVQRNERTGDITRSGINVTRQDFVLMGAFISEYEESVGNPNLAAIRAIVRKPGSNVRKDKNVFAEIAKFYINKEALKSDAPMKATEALATAIGKFMVDVRHDADAITAYTAANAENVDPVLRPVPLPAMAQ